MAEEDVVPDQSKEKGWILNLDLWAPYRGKYPEPTAREFHLICHFLRPVDFERDDFVEDEDWKSLQEEVGVENLRGELMEYLHRVRESKGYDLDSCIDFFISPFTPLEMSETKDKATYDRMMQAAGVAITAINVETRKTGKIYELVKVEKLVRTRKRMFLLTLAVKELDAAGDIVMAEAEADAEEETDADSDAMKTIRAMVFDPVEGMELKEWKFKDLLQIFYETQALFSSFFPFLFPIRICNFLPARTNSAVSLEKN